jgi:hypothetical protein
MKIAKVKLMNHGTNGLAVEYDQEMDSGGMKFRNSLSGKYRMPVTPEIRMVLIKMEEHCKRMLRVEDQTLLSVVGVLGDVEKVSLMAQVMSYDSLDYNVTTAWMNEGTEYKDFAGLSRLVGELHELVALHVQGSTAMNSKQVLLDFKEYGDEKVKKEFVDLNLDSMSEEELLVKAKSILEKQGCIVMEPADFSVGEAEEVF